MTLKPYIIKNFLNRKWTKSATAWFIARTLSLTCLFLGTILLLQFIEHTLASMSGETSTTTNILELKNGAWRTSRAFISIASSVNLLILTADCIFRIFRKMQINQLHIEIDFLIWLSILFTALLLEI